jgi:hypothetical protein
VASLSRLLWIVAVLFGKQRHHHLILGYIIYCEITTDKIEKLLAVAPKYGIDIMLPGKKQGFRWRRRRSGQGRKPARRPP